MTLRTAVTSGASLSSLAAGADFRRDHHLPAAGSTVGTIGAAAVTLLDRTVAI